MNAPKNNSTHIASAILPVTIPVIAMPFPGFFTPKIPNINASIEHGIEINQAHHITIDTIPSTIAATLSPGVFSLFITSVSLFSIRFISP